jgi:hypothetical protein
MGLRALGLRSSLAVRKSRLPRKSFRSQTLVRLMAKVTPADLKVKTGFCRRSKRLGNGDVFPFIVLS